MLVTNGMESCVVHALVHFVVYFFDPSFGVGLFLGAKIKTFNMGVACVFIVIVFVLV